MTSSITVYGIRQKSTGYFMPSGRKRGFSRDEPTANCVPRLFLKRTAAHLALRAWLQGVWEETYNYDGEPDGFDVKHVSGRSADDMEIVQLAIYEVHRTDDQSPGLPVTRADEVIEIDEQGIVSVVPIATSA